MPTNNTEHIIAASQRRRVNCLDCVHAVLNDIDQHGGDATVTGVAARAGVSRTFLYDPRQAALLERLHTIQAGQPHPRQPPLLTQQLISTPSHKAIVKALRDRSQRLEHENQKLRDELAIALGQLRELRRRQTGPTPFASTPED